MKFIPSSDIWDKVYNESPIGIALICQEGKWLKVNNQLCEILGYSESELLTMTSKDVTYFQDWFAHQSMVDKLNLEELTHFEMLQRYMTKAGKLVWIRLVVWPIKVKVGEKNMYVSHILPLANGEKAKIEKIGDNKFQIRPTISIFEFISDNLKEVVVAIVFSISLLVALGIAVWGNIERANLLEKRLDFVEKFFTHPDVPLLPQK